MKWWNLKNNKCPKCNKDWTEDLLIEETFDPTKSDMMMQHPCGFMIRQSKYKKIITGMVETDIDEANRQKRSRVD